MKKKLLTKFLVMSLSAALFATSIPVNAITAKAEEGETQETVSVIETDEAGQEVAEEDVTDNEAETETEVEAETETETEVETETEAETEVEAETEAEANATEDTEAADEGEETSSEKIDLLSYDWKSATDEELDNAIHNAEFTNIGLWLCCLSEEELSEVLEKDTLLKETALIKTYEEDNSEEDRKLLSTEEMPYYEYVLNYVREESQTLKGTFKDAGSCNVYISGILGEAAQTIRIDITGLKGSLTDPTELTEVGDYSVVTVPKTDASSRFYLSDDGRAMRNANYQTWTEAGRPTKYKDGEYFKYISIAARLNKPAGYTVTASVSNNGKWKAFVSDKTSGTDAYSSSAYTSGKTEKVVLKGFHRAFDIGLVEDSKDQTASNTISKFTFTFTPHYYSVQYGSSNTGNILWGTNHTAPSAADLTKTVTYNANGGTACQATSYTRTFAYWSVANWGNLYAGDQKYPSKEGSYTGTAVYNKGSVKLPSTSKSYTVTYNGGNSGTPAQATSTSTLPFNGWYSGSTRVGGAGDTWNNLENDATVTASWGTPSSVTLPSAIPAQYTVTFDSDGGAAVPSKTTNRTFAGWAGAGAAGASYTPNGNVTLTANYSNETITLPSATKKGYTFSHWENGSQTYVENSAFAPKSNTTLTAKWDANNYTIKLDPATGTLPEGSDTVSATYDQKAELPIPTKKGYVFKGWKSENALYAPADGKVEVINLSENDGDTVNLTAEWEAGNVTYTVKIYEYNKNTEKYDFKEEYTETAIADSQITVPAKDRKGFITPASQIVTVSADGTTVVEFKYDPKEDIVFPDIPDNKVDTSEILNKLDHLTSLAELTSKDYDTIETLIASMTTLSKDMSHKLLDVIKKSSVLSEKDKIDILTAIAKGYITPAEKEKLLKAIEASALSDIEKQQLISAIQSLSTLSLEEQIKIRELLEKGSSVSYTINGITFEIHKNADGTLSILLKGLNGEKNVVIPDAVTVAGKTYAVTEISKEAFKNNTVIETVKMGNNITKIGASAFEGCTNLKSVIIGPSVKEIGAKAFKGCSNLTTIDIPKSVTTIGDSAFENCTKLKTVTLHDGLLQIGTKAFYNCKALTKIKIPKTVLKIKSYAFGKCAKLKSASFAAGSNLTTMSSGVFSNCKSLEKITLPAKLTSIPSKTFYNDTKLKSCTGGAKVTSIGSRAFEKCTKLKKFTVQSKVQTIGEKAFYNCKSLKYITIKSKALTSVGEKAAKKCNKALKIKCPTNKKTAYAKLWKGKY